MEPLSVASLLPSKTKFLYNSPNKILDVNTLTSIQNNDPNFDVTDFINLRQERREQLHDVCNEIYNKCIIKIKHLDEIGKTELIFEVPTKIPNNSLYTPDMCLGFIELK